MDPIFQVITVIFVAVFQAFGGAWFGAGLRALFERSLKAVGLITSGIAFAGVATFMGGVYLLPVNPPLFYVGLVVVSIAALGGALLPSDYLQEIGIGTIIAIGLGGPAALIGVLLAVIGLSKWGSLGFEDIVLGSLMVSCWVLVGLVFFVSGLRALLQGKALGLRRAANGSMELVPTDELDAKTRDGERKKRGRKRVE